MNTRHICPSSRYTIYSVLLLIGISLLPLRSQLLLAQSGTARAQADSHILAGVKLLKQTGKHAQAVSHFKQAVALQPRYALGHLWLGDAYEKWGDASPPNSNARLSRYNSARKSYGDALQYAAPGSLDARDARRKRAEVEGKIAQTVIGPPIRVYLNNQEVPMPLRPITQASRVLLPLDAMMAALGARKIGYDPLANTITYELDQRVVQVQINVRVVTIKEKAGDIDNQRRVILAVPLTEIRSGGRDYAVIESSFFREAIGADVQYNARGRTVRIATGSFANAQPQVAVGKLLQLDPVEPITLRVQAEGAEQTFTAAANVPVVRRTAMSGDVAAQLVGLNASDFTERISLSDLMRGDEIAVKFRHDKGVEWIAKLSGSIVASATPIPVPTEGPAVIPVPVASTPATAQAAHTGGVLSLAISNDGSTLLSGGGDRTIKVWKTSQGELQWVRTLNVSAAFRGIAISPDGNSAAAACVDRSVRTFDVRDGRLLKTLAGHVGPVEAVAFSPDGVFLAAGAREDVSVLARGEVRLWHVASGNLKQKLPDLQSGNTGLVFSRNGVLATLSGRFYVDLWKIEGGSYDYDRSFLERWGRMEDVSFSPDGQLVVVANEDGSLRLWATTGPVERANKWRTQAAGALAAVAFAADGKTIVTGSSDGMLRQWATRDGKALQSWLNSNSKARINALAFDRTNRLYVADAEGKISSWNVKVQ